MEYDYEKFKQVIFQMTGINLTDYKEKQMKRRIDSLIIKRGFANYEEYVFKGLKADKIIYDEFINYITINVSEFYRNPRQWETLEKDILPVLLKKNRNLRIWSAACSTGEEPYSLVMLLSKFMPLNQIRIMATDIDKEILNKAKAGLYNSKSFESLPKEFISAYFDKEGELYKVRDEIKRCVDFQNHNLLADKYPENLDLIICRNVLIYFTEEAKSTVYDKFSNSLKTGGVLFVGSTEQIIMASRYKFKSNYTFFYEKEAESSYTPNSMF